MKDYVFLYDTWAYMHISMLVLANPNASNALRVKCLDTKWQGDPIDVIYDNIRRAFHPLIINSFMIWPHLSTDVR